MCFLFFCFFFLGVGLDRCFASVRFRRFALFARPSSAEVQVGLSHAGTGYVAYPTRPKSE